MENITYENIILGQNEDPRKFYNWCLENNLYKEDSKNFKSMLKRNFTLENEYLGASFVVAYHDKNPVGLIMLGHALDRNNKIQEDQGGILYQDNYRRKNPWEKRFDFKFVYLGFLGVYVKEEYRKHGIAKEMFSILEENEIKRIVYSGLNIDNTYLVLTARGLAEKIVKKSELIMPVFCRQYQLNYNSEISYLSYQLYFENKLIKKLTDMLEQKDNNENKFKR